MPGVVWEIMDDRVPVRVEDVLELLLKNRAADASFFTSSLKDLECSLAMRGMKEGAQLIVRHLLKGTSSCSWVTTTVTASPPWPR